MAPPTKKMFGASQVVSHRQKEDLYLVIHDKVYDVSNFIEQHPGGQAVLIDQGGLDASEAFEEVGHSDAARELLQTLQIGILNRQPGDEKILGSSGIAYKSYTEVFSNSSQWKPLHLLLVFVVSIVIFAAWIWAQK